MSSNLSREKRQELLEKIGEIRTFLEEHGAEEQLLASLGEVAREAAHKGYGLVFEQHREDEEERLAAAAPVFLYS